VLKPQLARDSNINHTIDAIKKNRSTALVISVYLYCYACCVCVSVGWL